MLHWHSLTETGNMGYVLTFSRWKVRFRIWREQNLMKFNRKSSNQIFKDYSFTRILYQYQLPLSFPWALVLISNLIRIHSSTSLSSLLIDPWRHATTNRGHIPYVRSTSPTNHFTSFSFSSLSICRFDFWYEKCHMVPPPPDDVDNNSAIH